MKLRLQPVDNGHWRSRGLLWNDEVYSLIFDICEEEFCLPLLLTVFFILAWPGALSSMINLLLLLLLNSPYLCRQTATNSQNSLQEA